MLCCGASTSRARRHSSPRSPSPAHSRCCISSFIAEVFPQQFTILFLVLAFYAAEGLMRGLASRGGDWLIFALTTAALVVNHQPHALFVAFYLGLYGAANLALDRWQVAKLPLLASAGAIGLAIATFAVVPIIAEADWVMIESDSGLLRLQLPTLQRLSHLIVWRNSRTTWGIDYWAYLGIAPIALALLGGWAALSRRLPKRSALALALLPGVVAAFFLYNPVVRDVMFIVFFLGLFAALGVEHVAAVERPGGRMVMAIFVAVVLDVASTSVQPIARSDKQFLIDAGRYLERSAATQRFLEVDFERDGSFGVNIGPSASPISYYSTVARVAGVHNMAATRVHNYAETIAKLAEADLRHDGRLGAETEALVGQLDAARLVCFGPSGVGCPASFLDTEQEPPLGALIRIPDAAPAIFSRSLRELAPPHGLDKPMLWDEQFDGPDPQIERIIAFLHRYMQITGLDAHAPYASALAVRQLPLASAAARPAGNSAWHAEVTRYAVDLQRVRMTIATDGPGYAQLAHPWYPASEVLINGNRVQPIEGALDLMVVPLEAGENVIEIRPVATPIRTLSMVASGVALAIAFIVAGVLNRRSSRAVRSLDQA